jgi:hypothetical protein
MTGSIRSELDTLSPIVPLDDFCKLASFTKKQLGRSGTMKLFTKITILISANIVLSAVVVKGSDEVC